MFRHESQGKVRDGLLGDFASTEGLHFFFLPVNFQVAAQLSRTSQTLEYLLRAVFKQISVLAGIHEL